MTVCACCLAEGTSRRALLLATAVSLAGPAALRSARAQPLPPDPALLDDLVVANHILADQGVVDGFGHVSVRHDKDPSRYLLARSMAPALVARGDIVEYDLDSNPVDANGRASYLERFIHGEIYRARADVHAVVHSHSPAVIPFADTAVPLRPMNHIAGFLGTGAPVFEIRRAGGASTDMLIRNAGLGRALAATLGPHQVALMRGHGSVAAAQSLPHVVFRAVYTQVNARMQAEAMQLGTPTFLNAAEADAAMKTNDALVERPWALWKQHALRTGS